MIFPNLAIWSSRRDARNAGDQFDRSLDKRQRRLCAGLWVSGDFSEIQGCLLVAQGRGKFVRYCHSSSVVQTIAAPTQQSCQRMLRDADVNFHECQLAIRDLSDELSQAIESLKVSAGKYVDRILAVGIQDPGLWTTDIDGQKVFRGFCDGSRVAATTGVNVLDEFPARDLASGGAGQPLWPLPLWLLLGDRSAPMASTTRIVVLDGASVGASESWNDSRESCDIATVELPPSDGLDANVPELQLSLQSIESLKEQLDARDPSNTEIIPIGSHEFVKSIAASLSRKFGANIQLDSFESKLGAETHFEAAVSAMLTLMHVDQMPANLPRITGADSQRILGRLSAGSATNWRNLIRSMAQYQPAPMKLRDAI